jgi:CDP-diacylglycerol--serine O-phosphatidyltransferase
MNIKAQVPNAITLINLFCGCVALVMVANNDFQLAFFFVCLGIFFDFFDGFFARKFNVSSPLGLQLDSLADMVTSGVVPGFVMFKLMLHLDSFGPGSYLPYLGFVITLGACYRLANFNIDERQTDSFIGLPTPANALFIMSLPLINVAFYDYNFSGVIFNKWFLSVLSFISAYIMNAEIPLFSLKIKNFSFSKYKLQIGFLVTSVLLLIFFQYLGIPIVIALYILLSIINNLSNKNKVANG